MSVGLKKPENILPVAGVRLAACYAGIRKTQKEDLVLIEIAEGAHTAATFTRNVFCAAPVTLAKGHLQRKAPRYLLINAGNANAGTGEQGLDRANQCCRAVALQATVDIDAVLPFSTGVIGEHLPVEKIEQAVPGLLQKLSAGAWMNAAHAIMTTDTVAKAFSRKVRLHGRDIAITGIAKGAGMICPDMATLLSFIATDVRINSATLAALHRQLVEESFNAITIDGDTSTNDACILIATGAAGVELTATDPAYPDFIAALSEVYKLLAQAVVRDAEGATKFVTVQVVKGADKNDCRKVAYAIAHSPLVKTALYASDANWGRILAAIGRAGIELDVTGVSLSINGVLIFQNGGRSSAYTEEQGTNAMSAEEIEITVDLGMGSAAATVWTSDLSHEYVSINADYRS